MMRQLDKLIAERIVGLGHGVAWIAFPAPSAALIPSPLRHVPSTALLRLANGTLWMVKAKGHLWTDQRLSRAAELIQEFFSIRTGQPLEQRLRDELDLPSLTMDSPALGIDIAKHWEIRPIAVAAFIRDADTRRALPRVEGSLGAAVNEVEASLVAALKAAINRLVGVLDDHALKVATQGDFVPEIYNYLAHEPTRWNRLQLSVTLPLFLLSLATERDDAAIRAMARAIDDGVPLVQTVSRHFGVTPSTVRGLIGTPISMIGKRWEQHPRGLLRLLDRLPPQDRPKQDPASWKRFNDAADGAERVFARPVWIGVLAASWMRHSMRSNASGARAKSILEAFNRETVTAIEAFRQSMIVTVGAELRLPERHREQLLDSCVSPVVDHFIASVSLRRLAELGTKWHRDLAIARSNIQGDVDIAKGRRYWPLLAHPYVSERSGRRIVPLTTLWELHAQGTALQICLARSQLHSYDVMCKKGESFVVAVIDGKTGLRTSTAEISIVGKRTDKVVQAKLKQHTGHRNAAPTQLCASAVCELLDFLGTPAAQRHLRVGLNSIASLAQRGDSGTDDFDYAARVAAFRQTIGDQQYEALIHRVFDRIVARTEGPASKEQPDSRGPTLWISELLTALAGAST